VNIEVGEPKPTEFRSENDDLARLIGEGAAEQGDEALELAELAAMASFEVIQGLDD